MRDSGQIEQLARGLYRLADMPSLSQSDLVTVAAKSPQAMIYLVSALSFHKLTTQIPHEVWIAIEHKAKAPKMDYPPLRIIRSTGDAMSQGVEQMAVDVLFTPFTV
jgi:predicted transcriptional regulator of viral defense system